MFVDSYFLGSKLVVNWINGFFPSRNILLRSIIEDISYIIGSLTSFTCSHIYKEMDYDAVCLSKDDLNLEKDNWVIIEQDDDFYKSNCFIAET